MKITDSSNMGTVNHATENLQHRILDFFKYQLLSDYQAVRGKGIEREEREEQKSSG